MWSILLALVACAPSDEAAGADFLDAVCSRRDACTAEMGVNGTSTADCYAANEAAYADGWCPDGVDTEALDECMAWYAAATCEDLLYSPPSCEICP